jgi:beta-mannosidase
LLNESWQLGYLSTPLTDMAELNGVIKWIPARIPDSVQWSLFEAGELPHPYHGLNSQKYAWVPDKVWYYRRSFHAPRRNDGDFVFLCFDGVAYHSRVWLNGVLLGQHEGMHGGPVVEISQGLRLGSENLLVVEVRAPCWGMDPWNEEALRKVMVAWGIGGGNAFVTYKSGIGTKEFLPFGLWRDVRLEVVPYAHMERPFLVTVATERNEAALSLSIEVLINTHSLEHRLHPPGWGQLGFFPDAMRTQKAAPLQLQVGLFLPGTAKPEISFQLSPDLYEGRNFVAHDFKVPSPKLWWPNGLGEPNLYRVRIELKNGDAVLDTIEFDFGIRVIKRLPTPMPRTLDRWTNWHFSVNGRPFFVKGMNWAWPMDILLHLPEKRVRWQLEAARSAGIQMLRVPGLGGIVETEEFFNLCDRLGIMVAQDFPIANVPASNWPVHEWESQVTHIIYRLRNRASLVAWFGGNEFNPYVAENTAVCGVMERNVADFDGTRLFLRATPDKGCSHLYPDMDPTWAAHIYKYLPFLCEYGIFDFCEPESIREVVAAHELEGPLKGIFTEEFGQQRPELRHHFLQYFYGGPQKALWGRMALVDDVSALDLESLIDIGRASVGEFFQISFDLLQANYPRTTGVLGWSFTIPWPIVFPCCLDAFGQATAMFYFLKRAFEETHIVVRLPHLLWAPGEMFPVNVSVLHSGDSGMNGMRAGVQILDDEFESLWQAAQTMDVAPGTSVNELFLGEFHFDASLADRLVFIIAELHSEAGTLVSRSVYWPRCLQCMGDAEILDEYRRSPKPSLMLPDGPLLRPRVAARPTRLELSKPSWHSECAGESLLNIQVRNVGRVPSFMTQVEITGCRRSFYGDDNFFWLPAGESRNLEFRVQWREADAARGRVSARAWNADRVFES